MATKLAEVSLLYLSQTVTLMGTALDILVALMPQVHVCQYGDISFLFSNVTYLIYLPYDLLFLLSSCTVAPYSESLLS